MGGSSSKRNNREIFLTVVLISPVLIGISGPAEGLSDGMEYRFGWLSEPGWGQWIGADAVRCRFRAMKGTSRSAPAMTREISSTRWLLGIIGFIVLVLFLLATIAVFIPIFGLRTQTTVNGGSFAPTVTATSSP